MIRVDSIANFYIHDLYHSIDYTMYLHYSFAYKYHDSVITKRICRLNHHPNPMTSFKINKLQ